jgi:uncharacterized integral membrane protein
MNIKFTRYFSILIILILIVVLVVQNAEIVEVTFFLWRFEISRAILIFISMIVGSIGTLVALLPIIRNRNKNKEDSDNP